MFLKNEIHVYMSRRTESVFVAKMVLCGMYY
jgi:hypothetical protein